MRKFRQFLAAGVLLTTLCSAGCGSPSFSDMLTRYSVNLTGADVTIHYCDEMSKGVDVYAALTGSDAEAFLSAINYCTPISAPKGNYSVQLSAAYQITVSDAEAERLNIYYDDDNNWLVTEAAQQKGKDTVMRYHFYRPDPVFAALLEGAAEKKTTSEAVNTLETSSLVLRAGITTDMLAQDGTAVDYELYTGTYSYLESDPLFKIFTAQDLPDVLTDSEGLVVAALGSCPTTGYVVNISQIDYTDHLIRVFVHREEPLYPDDEEDVETFPYIMATCDLDDFPVGLTVVFVDQEFTILDVQNLQVP